MPVATKEQEDSVIAWVQAEYPMEQSSLQERERCLKLQTRLS